jgi:hypothetical protein
MKFKVGDLVTWEGHEARIAAIMQHPFRYIIEYTVRQSDVSGTIQHTFGRTKNVKEDELVAADGLMICPRCNIYDVDPNSKEGWCVKCTAFAPKPMDITPFAQALLAASQKELAWRVAFNETADRLLNDKSGQRISMKPIEDAKEEYMKALVTLHHEVRDWVMGVKHE